MRVKGCSNLVYGEQYRIFTGIFVKSVFESSNVYRQLRQLILENEVEVLWLETSTSEMCMHVQMYSQWHPVYTSVHCTVHWPGKLLAFCPDIELSSEQSLVPAARRERRAKTETKQHQPQDTGACFASHQQLGITGDMH